jgi:hypothetical protein
MTARKGNIGPSDIKNRYYMLSLTSIKKRRGKGRMKAAFQD